MTAAKMSWHSWARKDVGNVESRRGSQLRAEKGVPGTKGEWLCLRAPSCPLRLSCICATGTGKGVCWAAGEGSGGKMSKVAGRRVAITQWLGEEKAGNG